MIRRSTIVLLLILAVVVGFSVYFNKTKEKKASINSTTTPETKTSYLFEVTDGVPTSIRVESNAGETVELARDAGNAWALILPIEASADQASSEAAASQITTIRVTDHLPNISPKDVGLDTPEYQIVVKFTDGVERIAQIGVMTPTQSGYYARLKDGEIVIVGKSAVDAILGLLTNPPYVETPTPSPIPATVTETPLPATPEAGTPANETTTPKP